jgi:hypothetical protein
MRQRHPQPRETCAEAALAAGAQQPDCAGADAVATLGVQHACAGGVLVSASAGVQQADSADFSSAAPNIGMLPSVWNDSHAMPAGSVTQYLSERA